MCILCNHKCLFIIICRCNSRKISFILRTFFNFAYILYFFALFVFLFHLHLQTQSLLQHLFQLLQSLYYFTQTPTPISLLTTLLKLHRAKAILHKILQPILNENILLSTSFHQILPVSLHSSIGCSIKFLSFHYKQIVRI